jgi:predicted nucleic acid-binding Zn ribbon protein
MFRIGDQQTAAFQHAHDTMAEAVEQAIEFIAGGPAGAVEDRPVAAKSVGADARGGRS